MGRDAAGASEVARLLLLAGLAVGAPAAALADDPPPDDAVTAAEKAESAEAQEEKDKEKSKKLDDRIKSVQPKVFLKKKRVELFPYFGLDLNDPFSQHFLVGGSLAFHLVDSFAIEARGGGVVGSVKQGNVLRFIRVGAGAVPIEPPKLQFHADLDASWAPIYGKISLFGEGILHFDTYLTAGGGVFGTDAGVNPALNVGIGQRYFLTDWLVARIELRDYIYVESRLERSEVNNLLVLGFSVSGFFPTSFEYEFQ